MRAVGYLVLGVFALTPASAEASPSSGEVVAVIAGLAGAGAALGFAIVHSSVDSHQIAEGCITEADGKRTLMDSSKRVYSLLDSGVSVPVGQRAKLKGYKSGPKSAPTFQVDKVLKVYGPCQP
jgi:hypothetical protein